MRHIAVKLAEYTLFFSTFALIVIEEDYTLLEKLASLLFVAAVGYGARHASKEPGLGG